MIGPSLAEPGAQLRLGGVVFSDNPRLALARGRKPTCPAVQGGRRVFISLVVRSVAFEVVGLQPGGPDSD